MYCSGSLNNNWVIEKNIEKAIISASSWKQEV
jgi:hypothetical protein